MRLNRMPLSLMLDVEAANPWQCKHYLEGGQCKENPSEKDRYRGQINSTSLECRDTFLHTKLQSPRTVHLPDTPLLLGVVCSTPFSSPPALISFVSLVFSASWISLSSRSSAETVRWSSRKSGSQVDSSIFHLLWSA